MQKSVVVLLALSLVLFLAFQFRPAASPAQGQGAPNESIYCADANGDQRVDVSDAIGILNYLFVGENTPHCIAEGSGVVSRAEYDALLARVEALEAKADTTPQFVTGKYVGDGADRMIETGREGIPDSFHVLAGDGSVAQWSRRTEAWREMGDHPYIEFGEGGVFLPRTYSNGEHTWPNEWNLPGTQYFWVAMYGGR